jgi:3-oxoacyl-[acyl-carrier protein] reductase
MNRLVGRTAIVTGGAKGIGRAIAEAFALEGADVAIADIVTNDQAAAVIEAIQQASRKAIFIRTDVADELQVRSMVEAVQRDFGHIDILVNNAGIFTQALVENLSIADWDKVLGVNLRGTFLCARFVLPYMLQQRWGRIINIASQLGYIGGQEVAHYSASKGGVIAFTKALAREVATRNVLVNAIAPGPILTDLLASETEEWKSAKLAELPIGRFGEVGEVAPTAVFLASDDATYYVGQTLGPNGGDVMM